MTEGAGRDIQHKIVAIAGCRGGNRREPMDRFLLVDLDAEATRGLDYPLNICRGIRGFGSCGSGHRRA